MNYETATKFSLDDFRRDSAGKKVIVLYPWTNYRTLFLTHFVANDYEGLLYYRIMDGQTTLQGWLADMAVEWEQALGGFGKKLRTALKSSSAGDLGNALAADLGAYQKAQKSPVILFIDELDRIPIDTHLNKFFRALVAALPPKVQVAVSSRLLNFQPWYDFVAAGEALDLGTEYRKDQWIYTLDPRPRPQLEVYALGRGYALMNGQPITNWDGALPRNLFFFFMDHTLVTRDEIFAVFWPDLSVKEATNVFHVTKRKISERMSLKVDDGGNYELTQYSVGFYTPSDKVIRHYDVAEFQTAVEKAMVATKDEEEERLLIEAIDLYKAPFLQDNHMPWMLERRDQLRLLHSQALIGLGRLNRRRGDDRAALGFFIRALKETPEREDIHREVMNIYLRLDMIQDARDQYRRLADMLRDTLDIGPSRESQALYKLVESQA